MNTDTSSPHSCTPNPIPTAPNLHKCIHEFAQKVLPVLTRVLLVIAGGQNLFCFFWLRYQAIISCNYFESCYRWISELSVLSRIHYSNAGSSLLQRGGHGRCRPPTSPPLTNLLGKVRMWWDLLVKATPAAPWSSHPTLRFDPSRMGCLRGAKLGGCGELGMWSVPAMPGPKNSKFQLQTHFGYMTAQEGSPGDSGVTPGTWIRCYWTKSQNHFSWKAPPGSRSLFNPSLPCQLNQSTEGQSKH